MLCQLFSYDFWAWPSKTKCFLYFSFLFVCFSYRSCKILDIWDNIEPENRDNIPLCAELFKKSNPNFLRVFMNEEYFILKLFSQYVQVEFGKNSLTELSM